MAEIEQPDLTTLTVQLLSAYVANNSVAADDLAGLIQTTRAALAGPQEADAAPSPEYVPAVSTRKSQSSRDHLLSLIDGKPYKTLKRHLASHGLTPAEYRERYNLPKDYPMVAPAYSEMRREVSVRLGLGRRPSAPATAAEAPAKPEPAAAPAAKTPAVDAPEKAPKTAPKPRAKQAKTEKVEAVTESPAPKKKAAPKARARVAKADAGPAGESVAAAPAAAEDVAAKPKARSPRMARSKNG